MPLGVESVYSTKFEFFPDIVAVAVLGFPIWLAVCRNLLKVDAIKYFYVKKSDPICSRLPAIPDCNFIMTCI